MSNPISEQLLTVDDLAAKLQIAKQTIYNKVSANEIPFVKIGGALRFKPAEIAAWIDAQGKPKAEKVPA